MREGVNKGGCEAAGERKSRRRARLRGFLGSERGAAYVEFVIVAIPLFMLIFGIIEVGLIFWAAYELENATVAAARYVRTGQAQSGGWSVSQFRAQLCNNVVILTNCNTAVMIDVETFSTLAGIQAPNPITQNGSLNTSFSFQPGGPGAYVLVTAFYEWQLINPLVSSLLANLGDGNTLLRASAAFKNEPFPPT